MFPLDITENGWKMSRTNDKLRSWLAISLNF